MKSMMCSRCGKNPAVIFISRVEGDKTTPEGLCIKCAMEMNIGPVKQIMDSMGVTDDDIDDISDQFNSIMGYGDGNDEDDFEEGGATSMPDFERLLNSMNFKKKETDDEIDDETVDEFVDNDSASDDSELRKKQKADKKK